MFRSFKTRMARLSILGLYVAMMFQFSPIKELGHHLSPPEATVVCYTPKDSCSTRSPSPDGIKAELHFPACFLA
jgi:hypothetical protein